MGLLDFLDKEKRRERAIEKNTKRAQQKYGDASVRTRALYALRDDGSEAAITGLLRRYDVTVEPGITDREEKEWVCETLAAMGERAVGPIEAYIRARDAVTWPLKALEEIKGPVYTAQFVAKLLERMAGEYQRDHSKKITLMKHLTQLGQRSEAVTDALVAFLDDMDQDTVIGALEALAALDEEGRSREAVLALLKEKGEEHRRIRNSIFELLAHRAWPVTGYKPTVEALIEEPYYLTGDGIVKRRGRE
ncbi:MAG: hypothetical protein D6729_18745 [Deltaproteobacteria bacterium]|nr:MAG: hypothetical protein D6729_18745 [Deltaproteobacteria bacterium]